ncbi:MAG: hypothetical protein RML12_00745 [Xanthomonadales bacterium]|nr:hypothetical protein [Xanthomonadales bacterium]
MHVEGELVLERLAVVEAVAPEAFEDHPAHRMQPDLVGLGGEVVADLVEGVGIGHDLLARRAELGQGARDLAGGGEAGDHALGLEEQALDLGIRGRLLDHQQQVAQRDLLQVVPAAEALEQALEGRRRWSPRPRPPRGRSRAWCAPRASEAASRAPPRRSGAAGR